MSTSVATDTAMVGAGVATGGTIPLVVSIFNAVSSVFSIKRGTPHLSLQDALNLGNTTGDMFQKGLKKLLDPAPFSSLSDALVPASIKFCNDTRWWNEAHLPGFYIDVMKQINNHVNDPNPDPPAQKIQICFQAIAGWIARGVPSDNMKEYYSKWDFYLQSTVYPILRNLGETQIADALSNQTQSLAQTGKVDSGTGSGTNTGTGTGNTNQTDLSGILNKLGFGTGKTDGTSTDVTKYIPLLIGIALFVIVVKAIQ